MPLGQFDERIMDVLALVLSDTYTPGTPTVIPTNNSYDERIDVLQVSNTDTITHTVTIQLDNASPAHVLGEYDVPAGAGTGTTPPVDLLAAFLPTSYHYLFVQSGNALYLSVGEAINSGKHVYIAGLAGCF